MRVAPRTLAAGAILLLVLIGTGGGAAGAAAAGGAAVGAADQQDAAAPFEIETEPDPDPDSNLVTVRVTIEPTDARLVDLRVGMDRRSRSLLLPDSYATTISPSNSAVEVDHVGGNEFTVDELEPGERVVIEFRTVTTVSGAEAVAVAGIDVEYTRNGQRLSSEFVATGDTPGQPQDGSGQPLPLTAGAGGIALVAGLAGGVAIGRSRDEESIRREEVVETLDAVERHVENPIASSRLDGLRDRLAPDSDDEAGDGTGRESETDRSGERAASPLDGDDGGAGDGDDEIDIEL